jgi:RNA polymerase sigma factor (sigma-70 family)
MKGMVVRIKVSGFENESVEKLTLKEEKSGLLSVSTYLFNKVVDGERENVLMRLMGRFKSLRYEDLEEVYNDGCLVLWGKMMDKEFKLKEKSMVGYLVRVCRNIGMHYRRKVNEDIESLDRIMKRGYEVREDDERGIEEIFDVMDERGNEDERYEKLDRIWIKLKEVDRMILESYYVDGCKMEEIAKKIGYRNGNSVKSKKNKVLRRMIEMMKENEADFKNLPLAA